MNPYHADSLQEIYTTLDDLVQAFAIIALRTRIFPLLPASPTWEHHVSARSLLLSEKGSIVRLTAINVIYAIAQVHASQRAGQELDEEAGAFFLSLCERFEIRSDPKEPAPGFMREVEAIEAADKGLVEGLIANDGLTGGEGVGEFYRRTWLRSSSPTDLARQYEAILKNA